MTVCVGRGVVAFAILSFFSSLPVFAQAQGRSNDAQDLRRAKDAEVALYTAETLLAEEDRDGAFEALRVCLESYPDLPDARFLRARLFYSGGEYTRALDEIRQADEGLRKILALRERMQWARARSLRAAGGRIVGETDMSKRALLETVYLPEPIPALYSLLHGNILLRLDRLAEAVEKYEEALDVDPGLEAAANNLASVYYAEGQHARAMDVVTRARKRGATVTPELIRAIEDALARAGREARAPNGGQSAAGS